MLKHVAESMKAENLALKVFWKQLDREHNNVLNIDQIKDGLKKMLPKALDGVNYKRLGTALDQ